MDYGAEDFYTNLMQEAFPIWDAWNTRWERPLYHQTGILFITSQEMAPGGFEYESYQRLQQANIPVKRLDSRAIQQRFPTWNAQRYVDGYFNPRAGWAESCAVVAHLAADALAAGVEIHSGEAFDRLIETDARVAGILTTTGQRYQADSVILAAGSWTPKMLPDVSGRMWPDGQFALHFSPSNFHAYQPPSFPVWGADIHTTGWYGFPATDKGNLKIANHGPGWLVDPRDQSEVPVHAETAFREFLREALPGLAEAPLARTRLCFYTDTFDGDFWIDWVPNRPGLMVSSGGSGHGFKFAPVLGMLTADVLEHKPNRFASRFAWREPQAAANPPPRK